jgi:hypothetical protein
VCVVSLKRVKDQWQALAIEVATAEHLAQAQLAMAIPIGWSVEEGKLLCPWHALGNKAWPDEARDKTAIQCAKTGRTALLAGAGIEFSVEPVPPKVKMKFGNPDGDGEYKVSVKNPSDKAASVPALLTDGGKILWNESLVILCQGRVYPSPAAEGVKKAPQPATLKPGETVSTVVNVLQLQGPQWPRGGSRVEFLFALGEKSSTQSFYYLSKHHDPLREKAQGGK